MGCGSSSSTSDPRWKKSPGVSDFCENLSRIKYDKRTLRGKQCDIGKDEVGREDDFFDDEERLDGDACWAFAKPWFGQIAEPDNHGPIINEKPTVRYELEHVYGYHSTNVR